MSGIAHFDIYQDSVGGWRWRLVAANSEIVASGEGYTTQTDAMRAAETVVDICSRRPVIYAPDGGFRSSSILRCRPTRSRCGPGMIEYASRSTKMRPTSRAAAPATPRRTTGSARGAIRR